MTASIEGKALARAFRDAHDMSEVRIWEIDAPLNQLISTEGVRFEEVETNIWGRLAPAGERDLLYLGTGKHGDRITLRALFAKVGVGEGADARPAWINVNTGAEAPFPEDRKVRW